MNYFLTCSNCDNNLIVTDSHTHCPFCNSALNLYESVSIDFESMLDDLEKKTIYTKHDIDLLISSVRFLQDMNSKIASELGTALLQLHKFKDRVDWYRTNSLKQVR